MILFPGLPDKFKNKKRRKGDGVPYEEKEKLVLDGKIFESKFCSLILIF